MTSRSIERRAFKEVLVWIAVILTGYATFLAFEPAFETAKRTAVEAGFAHIFAVDGADKARPLESRVSAAVLNMRGTVIGEKPNKIAPTARKVTLTANNYGHFHARAKINGQDVEFMTDTGATYVALSYETAIKLGIPPASLRFNGRSTTANGVAKVASVMLDVVRVDDLAIRNVEAVVAEPGRMSQNLLGMSFIGRLSGFELAKDRLVMTE